MDVAFLDLVMDAEGGIDDFVWDLGIAGEFFTISFGQVGAR